MNVRDVLDRQAEEYSLIMKRNKLYAKMHSAIERIAVLGICVASFIFREQLIAAMSGLW